MIKRSNWWDKPLEWWLIITAGFILEYTAILKKKRRTLSRVVWRMKSDRIGKILLGGSWLWLTWHFFFDEGE